MSTSTEWQLPAGTVASLPTADEVAFLGRLGYWRSQVTAQRWIKPDRYGDQMHGEWVEWDYKAQVWMARRFGPDGRGGRMGHVPYFTSPTLTPVLVFIELERGNGA